MEEYGVYEVAPYEFIYIEKKIAEKHGMRQVSEAEQKDISYLVADEYITFFTDQTSECEGTSTGALGSWNYPEIMMSFREKVGHAHASLYNFKGYNGGKSVWAEMCDKYYGGKAHVYAEDMFDGHFDEFDSREIIAFLHYCVIYKERFGDGSYGQYAKEGYIGKLLIKLKELM